MEVESRKMYYSPVKNIASISELSTATRRIKGDDTYVDSFKISNHVRYIVHENIDVHQNAIKVLTKEQALKIIFRRRMRWAFKKICKKNWSKTKYYLSDMSRKQLMEEGFDQLDYVVKSDQQKNKVMAFTFIKNAFKEYKRKKQKRLKTASSMVQEFVSNKIKKQKYNAFFHLLTYSASRPRLNQYKFALHSMNNILTNSLNRIKKYAFQSILRNAIPSQKISSIQTSIQPKSSPQYICLVTDRPQRTRRNSQTFFLKIPLHSQQVYLDQYNIKTKRKHSTRRSSSYVKQTTRLSNKCSYCSYSIKCKYCDILKVLNI